MQDTFVTISASADAEEKKEQLCSGKFTTASLFVFVVYAASVYLYSLLAVRAPGAFLPLCTAIPHFVALAMLKTVVGTEASWVQEEIRIIGSCLGTDLHSCCPMHIAAFAKDPETLCIHVCILQSLYVFLSTLSLSLPLLLCLPLLRQGWVMVVGLLDLAASAANVFSVVKPGFFLWALFDAFVLRACMQEALKFAVCYQLREKQKVVVLKNLVFYGTLSAITFSLVMATNDAIRMIYHTPPPVPQRPGILWTFAIFHGAYELPIQIITAFLIACSVAVTRKESEASFLQVIRGPVLLYGIPAFCAQLAKHVNQNVAAKLLWGRHVEAIPQETLRAVTAVTAICHFLSTIVMIGSLLIGITLCRRAFLKAKSQQACGALVSKKSPGFLFSLQDIFQQDLADQSEESPLLGKEAEEEA